MWLIRAGSFGLAHSGRAQSVGTIVSGTALPSRDIADSLVPSIPREIPDRMRSIERHKASCLIANSLLTITCQEGRCWSPNTQLVNGRIATSRRLCRHSGFHPSRGPSNKPAFNSVVKLLAICNDRCHPLEWFSCRFHHAEVS